MVEIEKPRITCLEGEDISYGMYVVEPLERGYGMTLGNSLRLSINGGESTELPAGNPRNPIRFSVTNETEETAEFELAVSYEVGTSMNPAELVVGEQKWNVEY